MRLALFILTLTIFTLQTFARPLRPAREILAPKLDDRNKAPTLLGAHVVQRTGADKRKAAYVRAMASPREDGERKHRVLRFNQKRFAPERAQDLLSHTGPVVPPAAHEEQVASTTVVITPPQQTPTTTPTMTHAEAAAQTTMPAHRNGGKTKAKAKARKPKMDADVKRHSGGVKKIRTGRWH